MLVNIVDRRENSHNTLIDVVMEPAWHDNKVPGATQHDMVEGTSAERYQVTLASAIEWAQQTEGPQTLYLYTKKSRPPKPCSQRG